MKNLARIAAIALLAAASMARADDKDPDVTGPHWVVGNRAAQSCDLVTSSPVVEPQGNTWFSSGPYHSRDDAKLACSTISACPKVEDSKPQSDAR